MAVVVHRRGRVAELHRLDPFSERELAEPEVWWCDFTDAAIVLGSRQRPDLLDHEACERAGLSIVRRRSGGGAVLLRPRAMVWIDLVIPHGVAPDDVRGSMVWIGERWLQAIDDPIASRRSERGCELHRGGMVRTVWSDLVCFAGVGPGEVLADGRKLVGLSQRRTRHGLRIQGLVHRRPLLGEMPPLFVGPLPSVPLEEPAVQTDLVAPQFAARLADALAPT